jgi:hypothetical protein
MNKLFLILFSIILVSCGSGGSGGSSSSGGSNQPEIETFNRTYSYNSIGSESIKKIILTTLGDNTDVEVTFNNDSKKEYSLETVDEDNEEEVGYRLEDLCDDDSEGSSANFNIRLKSKNSSGDILLLGIQWEGTCGDQKLSCIGILEVDTFDENTQSVLDAYVMGEDSDGGCSSIQTAVEDLIENELD